MDPVAAPRRRARLVTRSAALGAAAGSRSTIGIAAPVLTSPGSSWPARAGVTLALGGELLADKLPGVPSRLEAPSLAARVAAAATGARQLARREGAGAAAPVVAAAVGAVAGSWGGATWRSIAGRRLPDGVAAIVEDVVALGLAWWVCRPRRGRRGLGLPVQDRSSPVRPAGDDKGAWLAVLEQGANLLQQTTPLKGFDVYVVGFHCGKNEPEMQMEAHHYCRVVNDDLLQCVIFDGNTADANLIGIEYIASEHLFDSLPAAEQAFWHPHNYEVFSGELIAPGLPLTAETAFMKRLVNSYGKTWHTWHTGRHDGEPGHELPLGEPKLMWSFNREGECDESLKQNRDEAMRLDPGERRLQRQQFVDLAHPQRGVDAMKDLFGRTTAPVPGVVDVRSST